TPNFANPSLGDVLGADFVSLVLDEAFNDEAKQGNGEWAGGVLRLRAAGPNREEHVITRNTVTPLGGGLFRNDIFLATTMVIPPAVSEEFQLVRAEYFEPDLNDPIDLAVYDPDNPELSNNTDLVNFVEVRDRLGNVIDVDAPVDALATLTFRFSEPMLLESFRP